MKLRINRSLPLISGVLLASVGFAIAGAASVVRAQAPANGGENGPNGDFPMVIGAPYSVGSTLYAPADTMNYDAVGHAELGVDGGTSISAAHHTLPVPSYVEVTSLASGRTILVRVERRGPMDSNRVIELSPGAAAQLGVGDNAAVRVRRVNPPESERAMLRAGDPAPERMETPKPLLEVLLRKLQPGAPVPLNPSSAGSEGQPAPTPVPARLAVRASGAAMHAKPAGKTPAKPPAGQPAAGPSFAKAFAGDDGLGARPGKSSAERPATARIAYANPVQAKSVQGKAAKARPAPPAPATESPGPGAESASTSYIQAGAFSVKANAEALAKKIGGTVSASGKLWRVRKGPYTSRAGAEAGLAKLKAAGYSGARIQRAD